ncbi:slit homolog 2 protein-like [Centruroides sculpturatus]|uniref:slit homolog 2 protein-like n=1 Tax=Centruroides sculpturatus TaxID=218467 RepID=UPI000C6EBA86|nr:slit homolog 2 protein-like [Centruroides sculpturatus]
MRLVIFSQFLFLVVNSCQEFWQHWGNVSCTSWADSCHESKNFSSVQIFDQSLSVKCGAETIDSDLMRCLDVKNIQEITFTDCFLSGIDFGVFTFGYKIEHVKIEYTLFVHERDFESASFNNMSSLRSVEIIDVKTSELLNLTFSNVPSLTSLTIKNYNFTLFPNKPFRELINLSELYITKGKLRVLPEDLFYNLHNLEKLRLILNKIESIHPLVFKNLVKLKYMELDLNKIKDLPSDMLNGLSHLRTFNISWNRQLSEIPSRLFNKLYNLTEINAHYCSISTLEEDVFSDLINLKIVTLNSNRIEHLPPNLLRNNKQLTRFSCSYNKVAKLPTKIFHGLSELRELDLRENQLENLPEDVFQNLSSLRRLDLSLNRLTFLHEKIFLPLTRLTDLDLSYNNLTKLTGKISLGSSKYLTYLNLYNTGLRRWPVINWTQYNLTDVILSNNNFETVKLPIYTPNRVKIYLFNCKIRTIYIDDRRYGFQMPIYDLNNNKITCDHKLQQFNFAVKSNIEVAKKIFPDIKDTKCFGEERNLLDNTSLVVIGNYCPINCECSAQDHHVMVNCSGKGIERIPEVLLPNATIVDLSNNYIKELSNVDCVTWRNVTHLRLSNNSISNISDYVILPNLKCLLLDGNQLTQLPSGLMNLIDVSTEFKIHLSRNNWTCHCHSRITKDWLLRNSQKIADFSDVFCTRNSSFVSFTEIISNEECTEIAEISLTSSVNDSSSIEYTIPEFCTFVDYFSTYLPQIRVSNGLEPSLDEMRWVFFFQSLFLAVNSCQEFWQHWGKVSCLSPAISCYESKNFSSVEILNQSLSIKCGKETIDSRLMRCLEVKNVQELTFRDCFLSGIDFGIFTFGHRIEHVNIWYLSILYERNFESASFNNMSSLRSVEIRGVKTSDLLNLTFRNVPSLTSLKIERYNFTLFPNKSFRELINLSELYITYGELKALPEDLFYNLHKLTKLDLSNNEIESIHPLVFRNLTRLEYLYLQWNRIKHLPNDMMKGLFNLRTFSITKNRDLPEIPSGFFNKLHNLTEFSAGGCSIYSLEEHVFSDLINLNIVDLNSNKIKELPPNLLRNNKLLTRFFCSFKIISSLPTGIFSGLSELRSLTLRGNRLQNLLEDVFQNLSSLETLILSENRLTYLHESIFLPLTKLNDLDLSENNLTKIIGERPFGISKHLNYLNLYKTGLTQWPTINWTEYNLTEVIFSNNRFETVNLPIYTPNRLKFYLSNCKIKTIYIDDSQYGFQMPTYYLSFNEITCNYELQQFVFALKSNIEVAKKMFPDIEKTKCHGEERNLLDNAPFVVIGNYCPVSCECFGKQNHVVVNCSGKGIDRIREVLLPNATIVDLSNNYINELSDVDCVTWRNVTHLRLSNNSLTNISDYVLLPNLKFLWLDGNRLTELPSGLMNLIDVSPEFKIYLSRNYLTCDCHSQFTKDWLLRNRQKIADFSDVFCARNSSSVSFIDIVSNDGCTEILEVNLASSVNDSPSNEY